MAKISNSAPNQVLDFSLVISVPVTANHGEVSQVNLGYAANAKVGMRIRGIEYYQNILQPDADIITAVGVSGGQLAFGLQISPSAPVAQPGPTDHGVIDWNLFRPNYDSKTAVGFQGNYPPNPFINKNFLGMWGEGKLVHPVSLYFWTFVSGVALDQICKLGCRIMYTLEDLNPDDNAELINQVLLERS